MSYQKILPDDLEDPNLYTKQGKLYQESGNFEAAITCYENAIRINADDIDAIDTRVTANEGDIAALQDTSVMYTDATQTAIALGGAGGTTISNVADGELSATSTERAGKVSVRWVADGPGRGNGHVASLSVGLN